ncbi:MAG TPA: DUF5714 domain-containing protein [Anaerolineaceae bacterium]|nr:DUF5714 domain-containing protein [Anaerolineaceae bacterium]
MNKGKYLSGCLICGQELVYLPQALAQTCVYCGKTFDSDAHCSQGHYVCDHCHSADAGDLIEQYCFQTRLTDPVEMAIILMSHPSVAMHGPEHHFLVPAVLLAAYYNHQGDGDKAVKIQQARKRAEGVPGGSCGTCGNCGAAVGTGIFVSLITGANPLSKQEWRLSNQMTAQSLVAIAEHGGPRCCKRDTFLALQSAQSFLQSEMGTVMEITSPIRCDFHALNRECLQTDCPFFL